MSMPRGSSKVGQLLPIRRGSMQLFHQQIALLLLVIQVETRAYRPCSGGTAAHQWNRPDTPPKSCPCAGTKKALALRLKEEQQAAYFALGERPRTKVATELRSRPRTGEAFELAEGRILRVTNHEGPQVADFNARSQRTTRTKECAWSIRTRIIGGSHLTAGHQLWSCPPRTRPMLTIRKR